MPGIIVDIGTGDGSFTYEIAKSNPDRFVIGIDPNHNDLVETSRKIYKKPQKGGLPNALFVLASIEDLPDELNGLADQIFINFPWAGLLTGIVEVEDKTWNSIKRISKLGTIVDIILSYGEGDKLSLPELDIETMRGKLLEIGFELAESKKLGPEDLKNYPSTWAKKLSFGKDRDYYYF